MTNLFGIFPYSTSLSVNPGLYVDPGLIQSFPSAINYGAVFAVLSMYQSRISPMFLGVSLTSKTNGTKTDTFERTTDSSAPRKQMVSKAKSYVGVVNSSAEGNRLFSPPGYKNTDWFKKHGSWGWCCDFAVSCAKDTLGSKYPKDMITSSPVTLVDKATENHNAYMTVPSTNKNSWLVANVKPGDIINMKGKGPSGKHIAIVESVDSNGKIRAINGNYSGGRVLVDTFDINTSCIYGFISLDKIAA